MFIILIDHEIQQITERIKCNMGYINLQNVGKSQCELVDDMVIMTIKKTLQSWTE